MEEAPPELASASQLTLTPDQQSQLVSWVREQAEKARNARGDKVIEWAQNLAFIGGNHWQEITSKSLPGGYGSKLVTPRVPYYRDRKTINRIGSFFRRELSKFTSQTPTCDVVPANAEDEAVRSAYVAQQAFDSISSSMELDAHFARMVWWMIATGTGFIKSWWDNNCVDPVSGQMGIIRYGSVSPFNIFVPDLREPEIEDQMWVINAYSKPVEWVENYYSAQLNGRVLSPTTADDKTQLTDRMLNLQNQGKANAVTLYEAWIRPGATPILPNGGVVIAVDDLLLSASNGWPYQHKQFPFTKFEHIPNSTFYADTPLRDLIPLQREYNKLRTDISEAGRRMARPQLAAIQGSIVPSKVTNEPGLIIAVKPGYQMPQPIPLTPLPSYYVEQQDTILADFEEISGQNDPSKGSAPTGVTAGTAINYLQEQADQFLTPEYQSIERGYEKIGRQTLELFVQYVDVSREIRTVGADDTFDVTLLKGEDIAGSTGLRVEAGSAVSHSKAASDQKVMDLFSVGIIDGPTALRMMELGGVQKFRDIINTAEVKAQRENTKMKMIDPTALAQEQQTAAMAYAQNPPADASGAPTPVAVDPFGQPDLSQIIPQLPPVVTVADFDIHEIHIETHNAFRMTAEFEALDPSVQQEFAKHVAMHQKMAQQGQLMNFLNQIPSAGGGGDAAPQAAPNASNGGPSAEAPDAGGPQPAGNGAVPDATGADSQLGASVVG